MTPEDVCERYGERMAEVEVMEGAAGEDNIWATEYGYRLSLTSGLPSSDQLHLRDFVWNMFRNAEKAGSANKEALPGEVQGGETTEVVKEGSARRCSVAPYWILTCWLSNPCLTYIGRMKRFDVRQAWRENSLSTS
ncbi:hypothetical protein PQX77_020877 [Marasmius sp. AFHP31]|nr:hypothetical protein PQX77_020877 [Marasmius sp. AFHP31]